MRRLMLIMGFFWGVWVSHIKDISYIIVSFALVGLLVFHLMVVGMRESKSADTGHQ